MNANCDSRASKTLCFCSSGDMQMACQQITGPAPMFGCASSQTCADTACETVIASGKCYVCDLLPLLSVQGADGKVCPRAPAGIHYRRPYFSVQPRFGSVIRSHDTFSAWNVHEAVAGRSDVAKMSRLRPAACRPAHANLAVPSGEQCSRYTLLRKQAVAQQPAAGGEQATAAAAAAPRRRRPRSSAAAFRNAARPRRRATAHQILRHVPPGAGGGSGAGAAVATHRRDWRRAWQGRRRLLVRNVCRIREQNSDRSLVATLPKVL